MKFTASEPRQLARHVRKAHNSQWINSFDLPDDLSEEDASFAHAVYENDWEIIYDNDSPDWSYQFEFDSWETNNLHWVAPSALTIWPTGHMELKIRHLSNQFTLKPDRGGNWTWTFDLSFFRNGTDTIPAFSRSYLVATLGWKEKHDNLLFKWEDSSLADWMSQTEAAEVTRARHPNPTPPGVVAPIIRGSF